MPDVSALDVSSLKVAELKEELAKRNLATNGLKKDLSSRLQEAIDAEGTSENVVIEDVEPASIDSKGKDISPDDVPEQDVKKDMAAEKANEDAAPPPPLEASDEDGKVEDENGDVSVNPVHESGTTATVEGGLSEPEEPSLDVETTSLADRMGEKAPPADEMEIEIGGEIEGEVEVQMEEPPPTLTDSETLETTDMKKIEDSRLPQRDYTDAMDKDVAKLSSKQPGGLSPYTDPASILSTDVTENAKLLASLEDSVLKLEKPSRSVYIVGLIRPLTLPSIRAKAEEFGELGGEDVKEENEVWLDGVKSHAYLTYKDEDSAAQAKKALSGSVYPPETGKEIQVFYIPHTIVDRCIAIEELAWQEDRGKIEIRAKVAEDDDSLFYSLHRVITGESRLPPPPVVRTDHRRPVPFNRNEPSRRGGMRPAFNNRGGPSHFAPPPRSGNHDRWNGYPADYDRSREAYYQPGNHHGRDYRRDPGEYSRERREERDDVGGGGAAVGLSRAEEKIRQVEARIRQDRARGSRDYYGNDSAMTSSSDRDHQSTSDFNYRSHRYDAPRWSTNGESYGRNAAYKDRPRNHSPPPSRRDYPERSRDDDGHRNWPRRD